MLLAAMNMPTRDRPAFTLFPAFLWPREGMPPMCGSYFSFDP